MGSVVSLVKSPSFKEAYDSLVCKLYAGYGAYHHDRVNQLIHVVFVPSILGSLMGLFLYLPIEGTQVSFLGMTPTWGWPALLHILLPLYADLPGGAVTLAMYIGLLKGSAEMFKFLGSNEAWKWFLFIQLFSWVAQFYGHAVHEKRRPALMDNLLQIFAAPFFVTLEVLFALGYKPWLKKACEARVGAMLKELRALDAKKKQKN